MKSIRSMCIVMMIVALCLFAFSGSALAVKKGGTLTIAFPASPKGLDPHLSTDTSSWSHYELSYESLVGFNEKMEVVPSLAESWEEPDDLTIIFHIRKGVKFHNGREMTAGDVKYSVDRMRNPKVSPRSSYWKAIESVDVLDDYKVRFKLKQIDVSLMEMLAANKVAAIVPKEIVEEHGDLKKAACGTGPFILKEHKPGVHTIYERNPNYWMKGLPHVDRIEMKIMKDEASRLAALRRGTVDITWFIAPQMANTAKKDKNLNVIIGAMSRQLKFYLHGDNFPGNNKKLRQAISCAIDREAMNKTIMLNFGQIPSAIPPTCVPYALSEEEIKTKLPYHHRDLNLAKKLMKEAGYPDGFEFEISTCTRSPDWTPAMEMVQAQLKEAGIKAKLVQRDWGVHLNMWKKGTYKGGLVMAGSTWYPVDRYLYTFYHSKSKSNVHGVNNPELDKLLDESLQTKDVEKRKEIWRKIQYSFAENVDCLFPYACPTKYEVVNKRVKNYMFLDNLSRIFVRQAWIDE